MCSASRGRRKSLQGNEVFNKTKKKKTEKKADRQVKRSKRRKKGTEEGCKRRVVVLLMVEVAVGQCRTTRTTTSGSGWSLGWPAAALWVWARSRGALWEARNQTHRKGIASVALASLVDRLLRYPWPLTSSPGPSLVFPFPQALNEQRDPALPAFLS